MESNTKPNRKHTKNIEEGIVFDVGSLYSWFKKLSDKRKRKGIRYSLANILVLMTMAKLSGEDKPSGIAEWVQNRGKLLGEMLGMEYPRMPHHSTYRRILSDCIEAAEMEEVMAGYLANQTKAERSIVIVIDGKTVRGTIARGEERGTHLLAAYLPEEGLVLAQVEVDGKENEINAAPRVLKSLDLRGKVVIGDAMHTQRSISVQIVNEGGDYVWLVKDNQPRLRWDLEKLFENQGPIPGLASLPDDFQFSKTVDKRHGRLEERKIMVSSMLKDYIDWPYLEQVFKLERRVKNIKTGKVHQETVYGITSLSSEKASPKQLLKIVRLEWEIENGLHYRRDVTFKEDATRLTKGNAGHIMAILNNLTLGLLALKGYHNMASARRYFAANPTDAFSLIYRL